MKVLDFPLKLSLNLFKPVLNKPSLSRLSLAKPSLNQVFACHLKTSFSKTRFILKPGLFLAGLLPCLCIRPFETICAHWSSASHSLYKLSFKYYFQNTFSIYTSFSTNYNVIHYFVIPLAFRPSHFETCGSSSVLFSCAKSILTQ